MLKQGMQDVRDIQEAYIINDRIVSQAPQGATRDLIALATCIRQHPGAWHAHAGWSLADGSQGSHMARAEVGMEA